jgi:hypothetical protein
MTNDPVAPSEDEDVTSRLLQIAGARPDVPASRAARVREAVYPEWASTARRRAVRRRALAGVGVLAAAAAVMFALRLAIVPRERSGVAPSGEVLATVERLEGSARLVRGVTGAEASDLNRGGVVRAGDWVATNPESNAALRLADGTSVRLDRGSRVRLISRAAIDLAAGAIYLDTGWESADGDSQAAGDPRRLAISRFEVRTPFGTAHDVGTQFEVAVRNALLRVRVRSGHVELRRGGASTSAPPGTQLTVAGDRVESASIPIFGPEWDWISQLAPPFEIEGRPLTAFLEHLSREHGWTVRFADAALAREAAGIILHGSITGLKPQEALMVALATSGLSARFKGGQVVVFRANDPT